MNLLQAAKDIIEKGEKATERPWEVDPDNDVVTVNKVAQTRQGPMRRQVYQGDLDDQGKYNSEFTVSTANHAPRIARALLEAVEVIRGGSEKGGVFWREDFLASLEKES